MFQERGRGGRVTIDVPPDIYLGVKRMADGGITLERLLNEGIERQFHPPIEFISGDSPDKNKRLVTFFENARELTLIGATLSPLEREEFGEFIANKIEGRSISSVTFAMIDPSLGENTLLYKFLEDRYASLSRSFKKELIKTAQIVKNLCETGSKMGVPVKVLGIASTESELYEMVIADQFSPACRIAFIPFGNTYSLESYLLLRPNTQEVRNAQDILLRHYMVIVSLARPITISIS